MHPWLEQCEKWLVSQYKTNLNLQITGDPVRLRWLSEKSLSTETIKKDAQGLAIEDNDIGWLIYILPYNPANFEHQGNQALMLRSRLLREANYSGNREANDLEDKHSTWRIALVWLVDQEMWDDWQHQIQEIRRDSGIADEVSFDAIRIQQDGVHAALNKHGMPRLLLNMRSLLVQSVDNAEKWLSADNQVVDEMENISQAFSTSRTRVFAREIEKRVKAYERIGMSRSYDEARQLRHFCVKNFRNIERMQIDVDSEDKSAAQAIILFGPNGTGKSSFVEALSLAAFGTSHRLEMFLADKDLRKPVVETYHRDYLTPLRHTKGVPRYIWHKDIEEENNFELHGDDSNVRSFDGVILDQEDSIEFTRMSREELAARVLKGYSALADSISSWLLEEENRANAIKLEFTRAHGLSGAIKLSASAYKGLAQTGLQKQFQYPSAEFLEWLRFWSRMSNDDGKHAAKLLEDWTNQQATAVTRLAGVIAKLFETNATQIQIADEIRERLYEYDGLARQSDALCQSIARRTTEIVDQIDKALIQIEAWGVWLASSSSEATINKLDVQSLKAEIEALAKRKSEVEREGKALRGRLDLLDQTKQYLSNCWVAQHPNTCPICNSDLAEQQGINAVVSSLQNETIAMLETTRSRYVEIQNMQKNLDAKMKVSALSAGPLAIEEQTRLREWLRYLIPEDAKLEDYLVVRESRAKLKADFQRMGNIPEPPKPYADGVFEADRLASSFIELAQKADKALEDPQAISEVRKAFELRLESVFKSHLPSTLGKVWQEISLNLTSAPWVLVDRPVLEIEQNGKGLAVKAQGTDRYIRYIYNAAERHILGVAWFFTYYLARRRFEEAWILLDDPAQEMDQPSFREFVRFLETLLRLHQKQNRPFTMVVALHQEDRALAATRATNGKLYLLGWNKSQQDVSNTPSVKKKILLSPGYHPQKPDVLFEGARGTELN